MEKTINTLKENNYNEKIILNNRKTIHIEGIVEIVSTSDKLLTMKLKDTTLSIDGENIHITILDINAGILEADGNFNNIKYGKSNNILKRIFKWKSHTSFNLKSYAY